VAQIVQQLFAGEEVTVVSDPRTNSVIVSAPPWVIERTMKLISALDAPLASRQAATAASRPATQPARMPATHYVDGNRPRATDTAPARGKGP
jgi:type II secretory pathway component GspD/PulD (secretin)